MGDPVALSKYRFNDCSSEWTGGRVELRHDDKRTWAVHNRQCVQSDDQTTARSNGTQT